MAIVSKNPTSNAIIVTGWTNPTYIYNEDGTQLGTAAPGKAVYVTSDYSGFDFSSIPDGSTINSFTALVYAKASTGALTVLHLLWQPWSGGSAIGSEKDQIQLTTSLATYSQVWTLTAAQIKAVDFKIRLRGYRTGNTAYTLSVDYIRVTVDYTEPATQLVIQDVAQEQSVDSPALTQHHVLIIQDVGQGQSVENLLLTQHQILGIQDVTQAQAAENPDLTAHAPSTSLIIQDVSQSQAAEAPGLTQHNVLSIADAAQSQAADSPGLTQHNILSIADASQSQAAESPGLTQHNILSIADATQGQTAENVTLTPHAPGGVVLEIQDVSQTQAVETPGLIQHNILSIADASQGQSAENISLIVHNPGGVQLVIQDVTQAQTAESSSLIQHHILAIQDVEQLQSADLVDLSGSQVPILLLEGTFIGLLKGMDKKVNRP